jgi:hypothetical protein
MRNWTSGPGRIHCIVFSALLAPISIYPPIACALALRPSRGWTFEQLLRPPTAVELRRVDRDWAQKPWDLQDAQLTGTRTVPVGREQFESHLYTYTLNGSPRCGAVLVPHATAEKSLAGLLDIGDIRWDYPDRNLTKGPYVANILGDFAREFAVLIPCSRGTGLRVGDLRVQSGGDRRDAWEGDAEDAIAFLTLALSTTPQIDPRRLGVYGYSRGGGVALIVGERDPRIKAVLDFAGPTDWFWAMGRPGENWPSRLEAAWRDSTLQPDTRESQFLDFFIRGREALSLADLRRRLVAASPLYFTEKLPATQIHHGETDAPVPVRNATAIRGRLAHDESHEVFIHAGAGHLLDETAAWSIARAFLVERIVARRPGPR